MRLLIITNYPFPYGLAQTNRLIAIARGLHHAGAEVEVVISKATEVDYKRNNRATGNYHGIPFTYTTGATVRPARTWPRAVLFYRGLIGMYRHVIRANSQKKVDALFLGVYNNRITWMVYLLTRLLNIRFIQERSEYPFLSYTKGPAGRIKLGIYLKFICPRFDGFIVISRALKEYFTPFLKHTPIYLLPILVEPERFESGDVPVENVISYCGSMQGTKDGVPILIEAFARIAPRFPGTKLRLIGTTDFLGFDRLKEKIRELNLQERIVFTGMVERERMPLLLRQSKILALARPASKQAEGGFPTKLGEYLASGRPVVVTPVGDIPDYLVHGETALLATPGDADDFAQKLAHVLSDEQSGELIGQRGKKLAREVFHYRVRGVKLYDWLNGLIRS